MDPVILLLLVLLVVVIVGLGLLLIRRPSAVPDGGLGLMQQQLDALRAQMQESVGQLTTNVNRQLNAVTQQLQSTTGQIGSRLDNAAKVVGEVKHNLGELSKATQQVYDVGKDIASLQEILRAPKLRGVLGELFLGDLLGQILPPTQFTLQHRFKSGEIVDAAVRLGQFLVPIDSKFPLENFLRIHAAPEDERKSARRKFVSDVKKHIDAISKKYILPDEGTFSFALMYVPAENVYYETIIKDENLADEMSLCAYALERKVIPVSPNSLYAYLQAIVMGLKGLQIEKSAQLIITQLDALKRDLKKFSDLHDTTGTHLTNAFNKYQDASRQLVHLSDKLDQAGSGAIDERPAPAKELARPDQPARAEEQLKLS